MISPDSLKAKLALAGEFASALGTGAQLLPQFIGDAESLLSEKGTGTAKLEMVKNWVQGALDYAGHAAPVIEAVWAKLEPTIATLVTIYTGNGTFAALLNLTVPVKPAPVAA